jgi:hypothetical protein
VILVGYARGGGYPVDSSMAWLIFAAIFLVAIIGGLVRMLATLGMLAGFMKLLSGGAAAKAGDPSYTAAVLDGILKLETGGMVQSRPGIHLVGGVGGFGGVGGVSENDAFLQQALLVYAEVKKARGTPTQAGLRGLVSDGLLQRWSSESTASASASASHPLQMTSTRLISRQTTADTDIAVVRFTMRSLGNPLVVAGAEDWTFKRPLAATAAAFECPRCGAPDGVINGACRYCGAQVTMPAGASPPTLGGWVVDDVQPVASLAA